MQTKLKYISALVLSVCLFTACQQPGANSTGSEYMPDMAHSVAYEANYYSYYYHNTWGSEDEYYEMAVARTPVAGTIPRNTASNMTGALSYDYGASEEERTRAINEIIDNPLPITEAGLASAKSLYDVNCGICHGDKGDGQGYLVREDGGKYQAQPANFLLEEHLNASNGRYYHAIMYGKNVMGSYKDKLSYEERWNVIHYIRSLQAKELKKEYNQYTNTLNNVDRPAGDIAQVAHNANHDAVGHNEEEHHEGDQGHGHEHGGDNSHESDTQENHNGDQNSEVDHSNGDHSH